MVLYKFYLGQRRSFVVHHMVSGSYISRTVWPRITKFPADIIRTGLIYNHIVYDVTDYFRSQIVAKVTVKNATWVGFGSNFSRTRKARTKFYTLVGPIGLTNLPDITSPAASGLHLWKVEKTAVNTASDGFGSTFCRAAFRLSRPIGGLLVFYSVCRRGAQVGKPSRNCSDGEVISWLKNGEHKICHSSTNCASYWTA